MITDLPVASAKPRCSACDAVCCRLIVVLDEHDHVPAHLTEHTAQGLEVMAHGADGWCVAMDRASMSCSIYQTRPATCRRFVMAGPYCREVVSTYRDQKGRGIPLTAY